MKCRVWDNNHSIWYDDSIPFNLPSDEPRRVESYSITPDGKVLLCVNTKSGREYNTVNPKFVNICLSIGRKDVNASDIYEGQKVQVKNGYFKDVVYQVYFDEDQCAYRMISDDNEVIDFNDSIEVEIVGHIYTRS